MIAISTYSGECDGLGLAAEMAGIEVAAYCEADPKRRARLAKKHPGKPIFENDEELTEDALRAHGIHADFLFGGPPCQPFSVAGAGRAAADPRHRWPHMLRFIQEYRPRWVLVENVGGFVNLALDLVLADLENEGYEAWAIVLPALAVGAPHRRDRCFVVGYAHGGELREHIQNGRATAGEIDEAAGTGGAGGDRLAHRPGVRWREGWAKLQGFKGICKSAGGGDGRLADATGDGCRSGGSILGEGHLSHQPDREHPQGKQEGDGGVCGPGADGGALPGLADTQSQQRYRSVRPRRRRAGFADRCSLDNTCGSGRAGQYRGRADTQSTDGHPRDWRAIESRLGGVLDRVSHRLDEVKWPAWRGQAQHDWEPPRTAPNIPERPRRIESLGLSVCPYQALPLMALIKKMDDILWEP